MGDRPMTDADGTVTSDQEDRIGDLPDAASPGPGDEGSIARLLDEGRAYVETLPPEERRVASLAAGGMEAWEIAQQTGHSEASVARTLDGVIAALTGRPIRQVEVGGLGSDTDSGVSGGYGDTGFGGLDVEPTPDNVEPTEDG